MTSPHVPKLQEALARVNKTKVDASWINESLRQQAENAIMADLTMRGGGDLPVIKIQTIFPDRNPEKRFKVQLSSDDQGWHGSPAIQDFIRALREAKAGTFQVAADRSSNFDAHGTATLEDMHNKDKLVLSAATREDLVTGINTALAHKEYSIPGNYAKGLTL